MSLLSSSPSLLTRVPWQETQRRSTVASLHVLQLTCGHWMDKKSDSLTESRIPSNDLFCLLVPETAVIWIQCQVISLCLRANKSNSVRLMFLNRFWAYFQGKPEDRISMSSSSWLQLNVFSFQRLEARGMWLMVWEMVSGWFSRIFCSFSYKS